MSGHQWDLVFIAIVTALPPTLMALLAWWKSRESGQKVDAVIIATDAQHIVWNSRLDEFKDMIEELSTARGIAAGVEQERERAHQLRRESGERQVDMVVIREDDEGEIEKQEFRRHKDKPT